VPGENKKELISKHQMVEVFKTNVKDQREASLLIVKLHQGFQNYSANFDIDDCDRILRIECKLESVDTTAVIALLAQSGFHAETLEDEPIDEIQLLIDSSLK
jgi:hypothetical protein